MFVCCLTHDSSVFWDGILVISAAHGVYRFGVRGKGRCYICSLVL